MKKQAKVQTPNAEKMAEARPQSPPIDWSQYVVKPQHIYDGTDSEDDEVVTSRKPYVSTLTQLIPKLDFHGESPIVVRRFCHNLTQFIDRLPPTNFKDYKFKLGELSAPGESFCSWNAIKKYPYAYMGNKNRDKVATRFFDHGKLEERPWDL
jgi:hypothetical protein